MVALGMRIKLTDEDIWINEDYSNDHDIPNKGQFVYCPQLPWFATKEEVIQLKKQILEDYEFRERFNFEKVMELKQQNKELREKIKHYEGLADG